MSAELKHCLVSATGTMLADALSYPFELVATLVKSADGKVSTFRTSAQIIREKGLRSLYKGVSTVAYTGFFPNVAYYYMYDSLKRQARRFQSDPSLPLPAILPFFCSMMAESAFVLVMVPFDTVQTRMQLQAVHYNYRGMGHGLLDVVRHEGLFRLFSASPLYIAQFLTFTPLQFTAYEWLKTRQLRTQSHLTLPQTLWFTLLATSMAAAVTNPVNTLIVRFQLENYASRGNKAWQEAKNILAKSGPRELNKGLMIRLMERNINSLCFLPIYEMAGQYFHASSHY